MKIPTLQDAFRAQPQLLTGYRLLKLGETLTIHLHCPQGYDQGVLRIYPRYLENSPTDPPTFQSLAQLLEGVPCNTLTFSLCGECAQIQYRPEQPGSYMLRWSVGGEDLYRYFSVIEDDSIVVNFATFFELDPKPDFHEMGIPVDYKLPLENYYEEDVLYQAMLGYHREYGDLIVCKYPDTPNLNSRQRLEQMRPDWERLKAMFPDDGDFRSIRVDMAHYFDPGYQQTFAQLGINDHCGLWEANAVYWLGMPEFFYYTSENDCRKTDQTGLSPVMAHQWDFCPGFHFPGPPTWHYGSSDGDWDTAQRCLRDALDEAALCAEMSEHPAFITPLFEGVTPSLGYIRSGEEDCANGKLEAFLQRYKRFYAFQVTHQYKAVFARSLDIVDYYRRHYPTTPKTVFSSSTDHIMYDSWWQCLWTNEGILAAREQHPWRTRPSTVERCRKADAPLSNTNPLGIPQPLKDSMSYEFLIWEEQTRSLRFERDCPHPLWWMDYTDPAPFYTNGLPWRVAPDAVIHKILTRDGDEVMLQLTVESTPEEIEDYMIIVWDVPEPEALPVSDDARQIFVAHNKARECHLLIRFDLKKDAVLILRWKTKA